jgi:hypothetical protein
MLAAAMHRSLTATFYPPEPRTSNLEPRRGGSTLSTLSTLDPLDPRPSRPSTLDVLKASLLRQPCSATNVL